MFQDKVYIFSYISRDLRSFLSLTRRPRETAGDNGDKCITAHHVRTPERNNETAREGTSNCFCCLLLFCLFGIFFGFFSDVSTTSVQLEFLLHMSWVGCLKMIEGAQV